MEITKKQFGQFVTDRRRHAGLTQRELAMRLHVTESAVSKWERGLSYPDITMVAHLAGELGVTSQELISASEDRTGRLDQRDARNYRRWRGALLWTLLISYAATLLTCFIVNLSVSHTLTWFWIVLPAVALAFCLTVLPMLPVRAPGWWALTGSVVSLFALLLVVWLNYTQGSWLTISLAALLFTLVVVFGPILLRKFEPATPLNRHCTVLALAIDTAALVAFLVIIFVALERLDLLATPVLPIAAIGLVPVWLVALVIRYLPVNGLGKAAVVLLIVGVCAYGVQFAVNRVLGEPAEEGHLDLTSWNESTINSNVQLLVLVGTVLIAVALGIAAAVRGSRTKRGA